MEVSYLGNLSRKLPSSNLPINQIRPDILGPDHMSQKDRPFPQFSNVTIIAPTLGVSNYHAGVVRLEKRFARGFSVLSTYTFSKFLDNANEAGGSLGAEGGSYSNYYDRRPDYGPSENDIRHRCTWSSVFEIPSVSNEQCRAIHFGRLVYWFGDHATIRTALYGYNSDKHHKCILGGRFASGCFSQPESLG